MDAALMIRTARTAADLTIRELAARAGTSHSAVAAYESGVKEPRLSTLDRLLHAAGRTLEPRFASRVTDPDRGVELERVLELAAEFPARHSRTITYPPFARLVQARR